MNQLESAYQDLNRAMSVYKNDRNSYKLSRESEQNVQLLFNELQRRRRDNDDIKAIGAMIKQSELTSDVARAVLNQAYQHLGMHKFHTTGR